MISRTTQVTARIREAERKELKSFCEILDVTESQILREALREKLDQLRMDPRIRTAIARQVPIEMASIVFE